MTKGGVSKSVTKGPSAIFICDVGVDGFWAYPSPYVAREAEKIQFRNLVGSDIEISFKGVPVSPGSLSLGNGALGTVTVNDNATAGLYPYDAEVTVAVKTLGPKAIKVRGGSSPKIIIDT